MKPRSLRAVPVLFEDNPQPMWVFDPRTLRFLAVNAAAVSFFGYSRREFLAMTLQDVAATPGAAQRVAKLGTNVQDIGLRPLRKKDGSIVLMRVVTHPFELDGRTARFSVHADVSNEQAAAERAVAATAWFETFFNSSTDAIVVTAAPGGRITRVNAAFERLTGYTEAELVKKTFQDLTPARHRASGARAFRQLARGGVGSIDLEKEYRRKDGTLVPVLLRGFPIRVAGRTVGFAAIVRDITARRDAERALRDSERMLSSVISAVPDYIYRLDRAGRITFINRAVPWLSIEDVMGRPVYDFLPAGMRPVWRAKIAEVFHTKRPVSFESVGESKGGARHIFSNRFGPLLKDGRVEAVVASTIDVTGQKALELERERLRQELSESERYWRLLLEQTPDFTIVLDRTLRIRYINRYAKGYNAKNVIGVPFDKYMPPASGRVARAIVRRVMRDGKPATFETQGYGDGGQLRWYSTSAAPIVRGGRFDQIILAVRDVTEDKTLRARFEGVFNSSREALDYVSLDGVLLEVNPAHERLTGYSRAELVGTRRFLDLTPPEYHHLDRAAMRSLLETGQPQEFEKEYLRKDGSRVPVRLTTFLVKDPSGKPSGFAAIIQDISERKVLEREILEAGAREQSKLGGDLHDTLGQTLTGLSLLAKTLRSKLSGRGATGAHEAARLAELSSLAVRQARGLARGLLPRELQSAGLAGALRELAAQAKDLFGVDCRVVAPDDVRLGDEARAIQLYRIAQEAVHNAAKHARSKAGVTITLRSRDSTLRLEIADQGVGIPSPVKRGRGLGLGIMEHRARMIGATLTVRRGRRRGTVVVCECPVPALQRSA